MLRRNRFHVVVFIDPRLKQLGEEKMGEWRLWFDNRLDNAIEAAEVEAQLEGVDSTRRLYLH